MKLTLSSPMTRDINARMVRAGVYLTSKIRTYLNVSQRYRRTVRGNHIGLSPSAPGQFPKKLSGQLQKSITYEFDRARLMLTVGSNLKGYPSYLMTGTQRMKPRPWLSLAWEAEVNNVAKILTAP